MPNRSATCTVFGFDFQVNAAIVIMLENIRELKSIRMEGKEDIELQLNNGNYVLAQAKSVVKASQDFTNVIANLKKAMESLSEVGTNHEVEQLIYITNSTNPFNIKSESFIFSGLPTHRSYDDLLPKSKKKLDHIISNLTVPIDKSKLIIQTLPFETNNKKERYKYVWSAIEELLNKLGNLQISKEMLHEIWENDIFQSGTMGDQEIKLTKNDIIWPIIVLTIDNNNYDEELNEELDEAQIEEVKRLYSTIINTYTEKYEFLTKVLFAFNDFQKDKIVKDRIRLFISERYPDFLYIVDDANLNDELKEIIVKVIIRNILYKRYKIQKIKEQVNL